MKPENKRALEKKINEVNEIAEQTFYLEQREFELKQKIEANKAKISKVMGTRNKLNFRVDKYLAFGVNKYVKTDIEFFPSKLKISLGKKKYNDIVNKQFNVKDMGKLIKMLKEYNVSPKEFKKHIEIIEEVDKDKLDNMLSNDEITLDELQGCYKVEFDEKIVVNKIR